MPSKGLATRPIWVRILPGTPLAAGLGAESHDAPSPGKGGKRRHRGRTRRRQARPGTLSQAQKLITLSCVQNYRRARGGSSVTFKAVLSTASLEPHKDLSSIFSVLL